MAARSFEFQVETKTDTETEFHQAFDQRREREDFSLLPMDRVSRKCEEPESASSSDRSHFPSDDVDRTESYVNPQLTCLDLVLHSSTPFIASFRIHHTFALHSLPKIKGKSHFAILSLAISILVDDVAAFPSFHDGTFAAGTELLQILPATPR